MRVWVRSPLRTHLSLQCPSREGTSASPGKGPEPRQGASWLGRRREEISSLWEQGHCCWKWTTLSLTNIARIFRFSFVYLMCSEPTPAPQAVVSCFPALVPATAGADCSKEPTSDPAAQPSGGRGCRTGAGEPAGPWEFQQVSQA